MIRYISAIFLIPCGVPQGSIGGPLLWLCFTCDQPDIVHEHSVNGQDQNRGCNKNDWVIPGGNGDCGTLVGYVDDGAYSYAHADPNVLSEVLSRKYSLIEDWINGNKLVINPDKTHLIVMGLKKHARKREEVSINVGQYTVTPSESEKLLGCAYLLMLPCFTEDLQMMFSLLPSLQSTDETKVNC